MESLVEIRLASTEDSEAISAVLQNAFATFQFVYTPEAFAFTTPAAEVIRKRFDEKGAIWVAVKGKEIVGTVSVIPVNGRLYIRSMAVSPTTQGGGIGHKLLQTIDSYAFENGFKKIFLYTTDFLAEAIRLYERNGFEKIRDCGPEDFFGTPGLEMEKKLN